MQIILFNEMFSQRWIIRVESLKDKNFEGRPIDPMKDTSFIITIYVVRY